MCSSSPARSCASRRPSVSCDWRSFSWLPRSAGSKSVLRTAQQSGQIAHESLVVRAEFGLIRRMAGDQIRHLRQQVGIDAEDVQEERQLRCIQTGREYAGNLLAADLGDDLLECA